MIQIKTFVVNSFQENTFILWEDESLEALIFDAGCYEDQEFSTIENFISENNLKPIGLINTHCHIDHILGVSYFKSKYGIDFRAHPEEEKLANKAPLMGEIFGLKLKSVPVIDSFIAHGDEIRIGEFSLLAIHVPGHSSGSLTFYSKESGFALTGDALFQGSIGRTDLPGGDYDQLISSIKNNLLVLPPETVIYPGHGPSSTIAEEIESNPFL